VPVVVRQLVFIRPPCNLFGPTVRATVAVLLAPVALVEEALIVALELVVEDDAADVVKITLGDDPKRADRRQRLSIDPFVIGNHSARALRRGAGWPRAKGAGQRRALSDYSKRSTGNPLGTDRGISLRRLSGLAR
jgi:hypothetical protein